MKRSTSFLADFISIVSIALLLSVAASTRAQPLTAVSPAGSADMEGNIWFFPGGFPYPTAPTPEQFPGLPNGWRAHELHSGAAFDSFGTGPFELTGLAWRPDGSVNEETSTEWPMTLNLSTINTGTLSNTFADNIGPDGVTEVFSGALTLATDGVPRGDGLPHEFDYIVEFHTPFLYDPQQGDLLVEFIYTGAVVDEWAWVDADDTAGEFVFAPAADAEEAAPTFPRPGLFVTQFMIVPEPSTAVMAALAAVGLAVVGRARIPRT